MLHRQFHQDGNDRRVYRLTAMPLQLLSHCECCNRHLSPESNEAFICSLECTFCVNCAEARHRFVCPNCCGELVRRPRRAASIPGSRLELLAEQPIGSTGEAQSELTIDRLGPSHAREYREVMLEAYAEHPDAFTSTVAERAALPQAWWEDRLSDRPDAKEAVFGAFLGGAIVGVAGLASESREKLRHKSTLFGMYVRPDSRGRGAGRQLVLAILEHARARSVRIVQLTVTEGNASAETLYRKSGFVRFGLEPYAVAVDRGFVSKAHMWLEMK